MAISRDGSCLAPRIQPGSMTLAQPVHRRHPAQMQIPAASTRPNPLAGAAFRAISQGPTQDHGRTMGAASDQ